MIRAPLIIFTLILSGCAVTNPNVSGQWDCPAQQGRACTTIREADALSGQSNFLPAAVSVALDTPVSILPETDATNAVGAPAALDASVALVETAAPLIKASRIRQAEILGRVWFYPFVGATDHYHEGGFVHVILRPADWQTSPNHMFPKGAIE